MHRRYKTEAIHDTIVPTINTSLQKNSNLGDLEEGLPPRPLLLLHPPSSSPPAQARPALSSNHGVSRLLLHRPTIPRDHPRSIFNGLISKVTLLMIQPFPFLSSPFLPFLSFFFFNQQHGRTKWHTRVARKATSTLLAGRRCNNARIGLGPVRADTSARGTPADRLGNETSTTASGPAYIRAIVPVLIRAIVRAVVRYIVHACGRGLEIQGRSRSYPSRILV